MPGNCSYLKVNGKKKKKKKLRKGKATEGIQWVIKIGI